MGKTTGGVRTSARGGLQPGDADFKAIDIKNKASLKNIKDPALYKATKEAISRYHAVLGVRQRNVQLADLPQRTYGVHVTANGQSDGVYLNKKHFMKSKKQVEAAHKRGYESGWSTRTNKAVAHTVTHELAHATWNNHLTSPNARAASNEISKLFKAWKKDKKKTGYGKYAETNSNEFWAETVTKAIHGKKDKYTMKVKAICKKYKL